MGPQKDGSAYATHKPLLSALSRHQNRTAQGLSVAMMKVKTVAMPHQQDRDSQSSISK